MNLTIWAISIVVSILFVACLLYYFNNSKKVLKNNDHKFQKDGLRLMWDSEMHFTNKGEIELFRKPFIENLPEIMVSMDVDTTRFVEYVWAYRAAHGLNTGTFIYNIIGSENMKIETFMALFKEYNFKTQFFSNLVWRGYIVDEANPNIPDLVIHLTHYNIKEAYSIVVCGDHDKVKRWEKHFLERFQAPSIKKVHILTGVANDGTFKVIDRTIESEGADVGHDSFYPFITDGIKKLVKDFMASKQNILLLVGPPGTGKSTLSRTIMLECEFEHFGICNDQNALESPNISNWIGDFGDGTLVTLEDADNYIGCRQNGNSKMSALLNMSDGIIKTRRKLIISTNLPNVNQVDEALIRSGRTFMVINFRKLTVAEASTARLAIGLSELPEDHHIVGNLTLAEALNYESVNNIHTKSKKQVGFISA